MASTLFQSSSLVKTLLIVSISVNVVILSVVFYNRYINNHGTARSGYTYMGFRDKIYKYLKVDSTDVVFLGDSQTQRFDLSEILKKPNLKNRGIDGDRTEGVLKRLPQVTEGKPAKIFLQIGINDLLTKVRIKKAISNYNQIIYKIKKESPKSEVFVESILPTENVKKDSIEKYNHDVKELAQKHNLTYIDIYSYYADNGTLKDEFDCGDRLHLNGLGYLQWKDILTKYL